MEESETVTLFRPVGPGELKLIEEAGFRAFPPRLPEQPIFYPVLTEEYAAKIAREWNVPASGSGYVTRFEVTRRFLARYQVQNAGGRAFQEYWIPAEDMAEFNSNIVGKIELISEFKRNSGSMSGTVAIRPSEEADVPAITVIYHHHVLHGAASFEIDPPDAGEMARRRRAVIDGGYPYLVAEQDGRVVGYAYASAHRPRPAYRNTVENSVYVEPGRERQGIGRMLLKALLEACERCGFRQVVAVIGDSGHEASIGLHRALGFRMVGTLQSAGFKFGRWIDIVVMQRALGPGDSTPPSR